ncbi:MAG: NAD(+)/NADH kinase [Defluviitaleaceae bacterium]|nr:NAD(+)/NADH kinase [Defluviitaleaceae bacterium]
MKTIGILPNSTRDVNLEYTKTLLKWLDSKGYETHVGEDYPNAAHDICKKCDFVISLGGDGTILQNAALCAKHKTPLLGINLGSIGYLTDVEMHEGKQAIEKVLVGNYHIEKRILLETQIDDCVNLALNDICVLKRDTAKMITLDVLINGEYIDTYRADGIIVATPTGSTAYNLSAGGPVIKPDLNNMVITPISPYKIYSRPLVISGEDSVVIAAHEYSNAIVSVDGSTVQLTKDIKIKKSQNTVDIIRTTTQNFYDILRGKFSISGFQKIAAKSYSDST